MGQQRHGGKSVQAEPRQHVVGPFGEQPRFRKTLGAGKGRARVDDRDVEARCGRHRRERLGNVDGTDQKQADRRHVDGDEQVAALAADDGALAEPQAFADLLGEGIGGECVPRHDTQAPALEIAHQSHRPPRGPCRIQDGEIREFHVNPTSRPAP